MSEAEDTGAFTPIRDVSDKELSLLLLGEVAPDSSYDNLSIAVVVSARLRWWPLQEAVNGLLRRHEALRTVYVASADGFRKSVRPVGSVSLDIDVHVGSEDLHAYANRPFTMDGGSLVRVGLFHETQGDTICVTTHHLISDAASTYIVVEELLSMYEQVCRDDTLSAELIRPVPPMTPRPLSAASEEFWRRQLAGARPLATRMPFTWDDRSGEQHKSGVVDRLLPGALSAAVDRLRRELRVTDNIVYLTAYQALLFRHGAGRELIFGVPVNVRDAEHRGSVGDHVNTVLLRSAVAPRASFRSLATSARDTFVAVLAHADVTVDSLGRLLGQPAGSQRGWHFRYLFNYLPVRLDREFSVSGAEARTMNVENHHGRYDLEFFVLAGRTDARVRIVYDTTAFDRDDIDRLIDRFIHLLLAAGDRPDDVLATLPIGVAGEPAGPARAHRRSIVDVIGERAATTPEAVAFRRTDGATTFGDLWSWAVEIAERLGDSKVVSGVPVSVSSSTLDTTVAAVLGAWLAGAGVMIERADTGVATRLLIGGADLAAGAERARPMELAPATRRVVSPPRSSIPGATAAVVHVGRPVSAGITHARLAALVDDLGTRIGLQPDTSVSIDRGVGISAPAVALAALGRGAHVVLPSPHEGPVPGPDDAGAVAVVSADRPLPADGAEPHLATGTTVIVGRAGAAPIAGVHPGSGARVLVAYEHPVPGLLLAVGDAARYADGGGHRCAALGDEEVVVRDSTGLRLPAGLWGELHVGEMPTGLTGKVAGDGGVVVLPRPTDPDHHVPGPDRQSPPASPPASPPGHEEDLAAVLTLWRELLGQPELDADTDFFAAGGQSLIAVRVLQRTGRRVGFRVPLDTLTSAPTARSFAERLAVLRLGVERNAP